MSSVPEKPQFVPFSSFTGPAFWSKLTQCKLDDYKLSEAAQPIWGYFHNSDAPLLPCRHYVDFDSFDRSKKPPVNAYLTHGSVFVVNTLDAFRNFNKQQLIDDVGTEVWKDIISGHVYDDPSLLCRFALLCFVDIKTYNYTYWFAFPALCFPEEVRYFAQPQLLSAVYSPEEISEIEKLCCEFLRLAARPFFLLVDAGSTRTAGQRFSIEPLAKLRDDSFMETAKHNITVAFCDPSTSTTYPGWPLRNLLALLAKNSRLPQHVRILCWRSRLYREKFECSHSLVLQVNLGVPLENTQNSVLPRVVGWEKNDSGALGPRSVNLSASMDPARLAANAVNLNLQLMRWRIAPELDLGKISKTKCLLIGAGTLGSNVARCLLAWGVREITFVDSSKVNYNNPVRQSLFTFEDCVSGRKRKAVTAAENMKKIFPHVVTEGYDVHIPMPGHIIPEKEVGNIKETVALLDSLVQKHDVVFLLTDTRESRWLPTLLCTLRGKLCFSVALGFDSFVVVRHGFGRMLQQAIAQPLALGRSGLHTLCGDQLGCYFCTDVVAPGNSQKDRTLDQQCTVTRPGLALIASALAVELLVSLVQHPLGPLAAADTAELVHSSSEDNPLSIVPHQIRGFLSRFDQMTPCVQRFASCIACSEKVLLPYETDGFEFLLKVFNDPTTLENVTGLMELQYSCDTADVLEFDDSESIHSMEEL